MRAFGPQALPLSGNQFGITCLEAMPVGSWTRCAAFPEIWVEVMGEKGKISVRFIGLRPDQPLAFVFYVKAKSCRIGAEILLPKSLNRYQGVAQAIAFQGEGTGLQIECFPRKVQVVPLAGEGCFWDTEFLASFEIHSGDARIEFKYTASTR